MPSLVGKKNSRGFTFIELLVVISIIALVSTMGFVAYQQLSKKGRDAKRQADLKGIQSALEQFHLDHVYYPAVSTVCSTGMLTFNVACSLKSTDGLKTYLNNVPKDPNPSVSSYCYSPTPIGCDNSASNKCRSYTLDAKLESTSFGSYSCGGGGGFNYEVTPP